MKLRDRLIDWRLRRARENSGLPDLPEVRRYMRLAWCNGFTFGALAGDLAGARRQALEALRAE